VSIFKLKDRGVKMADPVVVGIDPGTLIFLGIGVCSIVGVIAYIKFSQYMHGRQLKNEIRQEITDKRQTEFAMNNTEEIREIKREIDKIQTK